MLLDLFSFKVTFGIGSELWADEMLENTTMVRHKIIDLINVMILKTLIYLIKIRGFIKFYNRELRQHTYLTALFSL